MCPDSDPIPNGGPIDPPLQNRRGDGNPQLEVDESALGIQVKLGQSEVQGRAGDNLAASCRLGLCRIEVSTGSLWQQSGLRSWRSRLRLWSGVPCESSRHFPICGRGLASGTPQGDSILIPGSECLGVPLLTPGDDFRRAGGKISGGARSGWFFGWRRSSRRIGGGRFSG